MLRVVVTGIGIISPVGNNKEDTWRSLCEGRGGINRLTAFDPSQFTSQIAGEIKHFDLTPFISAKEVRRMDKFVQYAVSGAKMAVEDAGIDLEKEDITRIGVLLGSGIGGLRVIETQHKILMERGPSRVSPFLIPMLIVNMAPGQVAISLGLKGPNSCVATACASGGHAVGDSFKIVQRGDAEIMITGGAEACITPLALAGFCSMKALSTRNDEPERASRPFDKERDGFIMAEGAGIIILESLDHAIKRKAQIYAEVIGYGMSGDAYHMTAPDPNGEGARLCMEAALRDARVSKENVSYINAHGTSTPLNDKVETLAIKKTFGSYAKKIPVSSTKSMTGHMLGATGGLEAAICALAIKDSVIPPTINYEVPDPDCDLDYVPNESRQQEIDVALSNSLGFGGHNAVLVLRRF